MVRSLLRGPRVCFGRAHARIHELARRLSRSLAGSSPRVCRLSSQAVPLQTAPFHSAPLRSAPPRSVRAALIARAPAILALVGVLLCGFADVARPAAGPAVRTDDAAARDLRLGKGLYDQGLFERAIPPLERVRKGNPNAAQREEALFLLGESHRSLEDWEKAEARFGELLRFAARSEMAPLAKLGRGEALVRLDRARQAVPLLESATKTLGASEGERPVAHYWLAEENKNVQGFKPYPDGIVRLAGLTLAK